MGEVAVLDGFWNVPLEGALVSLTPVLADDDLTRVDALFDKERVYAFGAGLKRRVGPEKLRRLLFEAPELQLWWLAPHGDGTPVALAAYSYLTRQDCIYIYFWDDPRHPPEDLWADALDLLSGHVLTHRPDAEAVFLNVELPVRPDTDVLLCQAGWVRLDTSLLFARPERAGYWLERHVYDLYHAPVDSEGDGDV